jgi:nucleoside-diphosphate-sugar epimerase
MRVLVTGSAGYCGPVVVRRLKEAGHTVVGYDTEWFGRDTESTWSVRGDIRDPLVHPDWPEVVVHMAGLSNDPMGELDTALTHDINYQGTAGMLWRFDKSRRQIVVSSCAVYGQCEGVATEQTLANPQTAYALNKHLIDRDWIELRNAISLRLGTVFGVSPNLRLDTVVNRMVFDAVNGGPVTTYGNAGRPLVHIEDVASAIAWAVEGDATGIYNCVGENVRMRDLGRAIASFAGIRLEQKDGGADTRDYMASGEKLLKAGWSPTHTVEGSLPVMFEKFLRYDQYDLPNHVRLTQLQRLMAAGELDPKTLRFAA